MKNPANIQDIRADLAHSQKASHRRRRRLLIAAGVVAVFVLFGFFGLPSIIKTQAIKHLSAALHRDVSIESVQVNPLVLSVTIDGLAIKDRDGSPFVGWKRLYVNFDSWSLFTGDWHFQEIDLDGFHGHVALNKDGSFNFSDLIPPPSAAPAPAGPSKPGRPLHISKLVVSSAALGFDDHTRAGPFATQAGPVSFTLSHFRTVGDPEAPYAFSAVTEAGETFNWRGTVSVDPVKSAGDFSVGGLSLKKYAPYYADRVRADVLGGKLDVSAHYVVNLAKDARVLALSNATIRLTGLQVAERGVSTPAVELPSFVIDGLSADGVKQSATIKSIALDHPSLHVRRDKDGAINLLTMLTPGPGSVAAPAAVPAAGPPVSAPPAALPDVKLGEFAIHGLSIAVEDLTTPTPAKNSVENIELSVKNVSLAEGASPIAVRLSALLPPGGEIGVEGTVVREPLSADLAVKVATLPLSGFTPYIEPFLNLRIAGGNFSVDGKARLAGKAASFQGDINVAGFTTVDGVRAEDFVKFSSFNILGLEATTEPLAAKIAEINLVDPVASFAINADKTTNFSNVLRKENPAPVAPAQTVAFTPAPAAAPSAPAPAAVPAGPVWSLGKFTLTNGTFTLSDRSVQPAVRTSLNQFSGTVTGLSSADLQRADVDFHGKVDGVGSVAVTGKLNARAATPDPSAATDIAVDIKGVDLSPLSPYVGTYAGYELDRGSLFVDVKTHLAQRRIDSANVVTLNQFTLGQATNNPKATKLPVRLGIALLKDIDGNIVIDLPVKGSLDDPNFKIGKVVLRVIVNLLVKAATSPFSLIGSMFGGGGDELAFQDFAPGAVSPLDTETKKIDTLRKALKSRPALNLDITGTYDADRDTEALRQQQLDRQVRARLWTELRAKDPATPPPDQIAVSPEDSARVVGEIFAEKFPSGAVVKSDGAVMAVPPPAPPPEYKPRAYHRGQPLVRPVAPAAPAASVKMPAGAVVTVSGDMKVQQVAPAPSLEEMRRLLTADIAVNDDDLRQLATARAQHVRDELLAGGAVEATRLFLTPVPAQGKGAKVLLQLK